MISGDSTASHIGSAKVYVGAHEGCPHRPFCRPPLLASLTYAVENLHVS